MARAKRIRRTAGEEKGADGTEKAGKRNVPAESSSSVSSDEGENSEENKPKWTNRERVLVFCSRGTSFRTRHLMNNFKTMMPHSKSENKMDKGKSLILINELAEIANCTKCLYFENRKHTDTYLWMSNVSDGPSVKFLVHNVHTMDELRLTGNCLKGSRPILSFDKVFDSKPHLMLIKNLLSHIFSTPHYHPRSQPFIDHVFTFSLTSDGKIWFRNFQIVDDTLELQEIGPRMVLEVIRIFAGSFEGAVIYDNPNYVSPNTIRREMKKAQSGKYIMKKLTEKGRADRRAELDKIKLPDPVGEVFDTSRPIKSAEAKEIKRKIENKRRRKKKKSVPSAQKDGKVVT